MEVIKSLFLHITNPSGSITGILLVIAGFMEKFLGCKAPENPLEATCEASWLVEIVPPQYVIYAAMFFGFITLIGKFLRPTSSKVKSLFGSTAVIAPSDKAGPGTVTMSQVKAH